MKLKGIACGALLALVSFAPTVSAAPVGLFNLTSGAQGVRVTATTIDWTPLGGPSGDIITSFGTLVNYDFGTLLPGVTGTILDLPPVPVNDFMTFTGHPALSFDLTGIGPGVANTDCASVDAAGESCSVFAGSPFILTYNGPGSTTVSLAALGVASDSTGLSNWFGSFTTQLNMTAAEIQAAFGPNGPGFVDSSYSGTFSLELIPVPEPVTMLLFGLGLTGVAYRARRRS